MLEISGGQGLEDEGCKKATTRRLGLGDLYSGLVSKIHIESSSHSSSPKSTLFEHSCLRGIISSSYCLGEFVVCLLPN